ncbi:MAG TPA: 3-hydroxyacyl-CoA dehydrogenase family protein [Chitinophagaceae bacterium]
MTVVILANEALKEELLMQGLQPSLTVHWINSVEEFNDHPDAAAFVDLLFNCETARLAILKELPVRPVVIAAMNIDHATLPSNFVSINGWPTFLKRTVVEAFCNDEEIKNKTKTVFSAFNKELSWTSSSTAFPTARVVAMIINEAYFTLEEKVSTKEEIDTAMKLGTNYPYGPFEWSKKIGLPKIVSLLETLAKEKKLYAPAPLLKMEAKQ